MLVIEIASTDGLRGDRLFAEWAKEQFPVSLTIDLPIQGPGDLGQIQLKIPKGFPEVLRENGVANRLIDG